VISPSQRPLPGNTQHSQQTDIHVTCGIRTHNPSKRAAAEPRLRPRGHWDRQDIPSVLIILKWTGPITANSSLFVCSNSKTLLISCRSVAVLRASNVLMTAVSVYLCIKMSLFGGFFIALLARCWFPWFLFKYFPQECVWLYSSCSWPPSAEGCLITTVTRSSHWKCKLLLSLPGAN